MTASTDNARFRSATDFPKNIQELDSMQASSTYEEMRDCLIFTNRSRAQLLRRNSEHKETTLQLRDRLTHFQNLIDQLKNQKQAQLIEKEALINQLAEEMTEMSTQLGVLSNAFNEVGDVEAEAQTHWGQLVFPARIVRLLRAVRSVMLWWNQRDGQSLPEDSDVVEIVHANATEADKQDQPQMHSDQASTGRYLLDR
ncbi:MAG: hypothetical protein WA947_08585 [Phormidesmis sp.]